MFLNSIKMHGTAVTKNVILTNKMQFLN